MQCWNKRFLSKNCNAKVSVTNFSSPIEPNLRKLHVNKGFPSWMGLALDLFLALSWKAQKLSSHTLFVESFAPHFRIVVERIPNPNPTFFGLGAIHKPCSHFLGDFGHPPTNVDTFTPIVANFGEFSTPLPLGGYVVYECPLRPFWKSRARASTNL